MPEGDTIHRTAARLRSVLVGRTLTHLEGPRLAREMPPAGTTVTAVEARGKHLLVHFDDGHVLHTHMRMTGSWHLYRVGERWRRSRSRLRVLLADDEVQAACFDAPVVELLDRQALARHPRLRSLGPDLLADPDLDEALARMAALVAGDRAIVAVLLDQRVAAGIGNVYASELCFLAGLHPLTPLAQVPIATRRQLLEEATRLLRANLDTTSRTTVPGAGSGALWVYDRAGRPCRRCGTAVVGRKVGDGARPTYWCPQCQPRRRGEGRGGGARVPATPRPATSEGHDVIDLPEVHPRAREQLAREVDVDEYAEIREVWKAHSVAEDARDLDGLVATLTPDCVYELVGTEHRWKGHDGARRFYTEFLGAFPDVAFFLQDITIGPQGVIEVARVSGTHVGEFGGWQPTGDRVEFTVVIMFPWDRDHRRFAGERVLALRDEHDEAP